MNTVKLMNATTGSRSVAVGHAITVFLGEEPGFRGKRPEFDVRKSGAGRWAVGDWSLPMTNEDKLAKLSQSGDHGLDSGNRRQPTWRHGVGEDALGDAGGPPNIRDRLAPARGMLLAFVLGLILWGVGIYLIATIV